MAERESGIIRTYDMSLQKEIKYAEVERAPYRVARQTDVLIDLLQGGYIPNPNPALYFLRQYTLPYLDAARRGADSVYSGIGMLTEADADEVSEAAHHANYTFSQMPERLTAQFNPEGYSRQGMLMPPRNREEFIERIEEVRRGMGHIMGDGVTNRLHVLRTHAFFQVGGSLDIDIKEDDTEKIKRLKEEDIWGQMLDGIAIDLP